VYSSGDFSSGENQSGDFSSGDFLLFWKKESPLSLTGIPRLKKNLSQALDTDDERLLR
jgi:hypothetical protein